MPADGESTGAPISSNQSFFVLNVWEEELCAGHTEWRGEIMDVENGAVHSFYDWPEVVDLIADVLHKQRPSGEVVPPAR